MNRKHDDKKLSEDNDGIIEPKKVSNLDHNAFRSSVGTYPKEIKLFPLELRPILDEEGRRRDDQGQSNDSICSYSDCPRRIERQNRIPRKIRDSQTVVHRSTQVSNRCSNRSDVYRNILGPTPDESILAGLQTFIDICGLADCCHSDSDERIPYGTIIESYALHETNETSRSLAESPSGEIIEEAYTTASSKSPSREATYLSATSQEATSFVTPKSSSATPPSSRKSRSKEKSPTSRDASYRRSQSNSLPSPPATPAFTSSKSSTATPLPSQESKSLEKTSPTSAQQYVKATIVESTKSSVTPLPKNKKQGKPLQSQEATTRQSNSNCPEKASVTYATLPPSQKRKKQDRSLQYRNATYRSSPSSTITPQEIAFGGTTMAYSTPPCSRKNRSESPPIAKVDLSNDQPADVSFVTSTPIHSPRQSSNESLKCAPLVKPSTTPPQSPPEQRSTNLVESDTTYMNTTTGVESSLNNYESAVGEDNSVYAPSSDSWCKIDECCGTHGDSTTCVKVKAKDGRDVCIKYRCRSIQSSLSAKCFPPVEIPPCEMNIKSCHLLDKGTDADSSDKIDTDSPCCCCSICANNRDECTICSEYGIAISRQVRLEYKKERCNGV